MSRSVGCRSGAVRCVARPVGAVRSTVAAVPAGRRIVALVLAVACGAVLLGGAGAPAAPAGGAKPKVAATIFPLFDIARTLAGPFAEVVLVLPPGASPHTFEPTPAAVRALGGAAVLFVVGHGLDDWAVRAARGVGVTRILPVDQGIELRRTGSGTVATVDPHYWLSIPNGRAIARTMAAELARVRPDHATEVQAALAAYLARLDEADQDIRRRLARLPTRRIATFHDAFGYFAEAYGLEIAAVFQPFAGREPGPRFVMDFQQKLRAADVGVVFAEPQLSVDVIRPIARDLGIAVAVLDPLGGVPGRESYVAMMEFDAAQVAAAATERRP